MSFETQLFYVWLLFASIFVFWRILTHPLERIHGAVMDGNLEAVRKCLEKGVNADTHRSNGVTPLYLAASGGYKEITELLITYGADVNQGLNENGGRNPLLKAATEKHSEVVESLIAHGALVGIHLAAFWGDFTTVRTYLELGDSINTINSTRNGGFTPLHLAALSGHREIVILLLNQSANINHYTPASDTPLHKAVEGNQPQIVDLLINQGAEINRIGNVGAPLHLAIYKNNIEMVALLIAKGAEVNQHDGRVDTPLHDAAQYGYTEIAELLLESGAQVNARSKFQAKTPLHYATWRKKLEVAELLIRYGADVNSRSWIGATPLSYANGYPELTVLLLSNGATDFGSVD
ncbi:ankyrin repeat domain-containing protein [Trichocoleus sp. FACHB-90]|uniref:ankyrin repeat domain-containing protein n=1 Tax=Cyanophyceae TaxID=3028117 RepID=UPI0016824535|nr:ankyrin repeat domain-containing protein [Trichocoleus sp. FACHB-90]MBD1925598.1 ankyrin repeat domain-containing protein [Trichocoleus sp. FACHB-90]